MTDAYKIFCDDSLNALKNIDSNSIDSLVTDPPAGIGFLKLDWDKDKGGRQEWTEWLEQILKECHRVLKPGAHGFVWAIPRTSHWTATALENSGFEIKDVITHVFGSGFPKSQSLDKMIQNSRRLDFTNIYKVTGWIRTRKKELKYTNKDMDTHAGVRGCTAHWTAKEGNLQAQIPTQHAWGKIKELLGEAPPEIESIVSSYHNRQMDPLVFKEQAELSRKWQGWGTALKPASEHWILVQKPIDCQNIAANVLKHQTGALNIDKTRIETNTLQPRPKKMDGAYSPFFGTFTDKKSTTSMYVPHEAGRFPSNFVMTTGSECCPVEEMNHEAQKNVAPYFKIFSPEKPFVYCTKPTSQEKGQFNSHPTVKPIKLMKYLLKMITPPNGVVLDPFMGSGTTGVSALFENFRFVGIEKNDEYFQICQKRLSGVLNKNQGASTSQISL